MAALQPERVILSAKSWLCNPLIERQAEILPWNSESVAVKLSPLAASQRLLAELKNAANTYLGNKAQSELAPRYVVTVPASFDEVARNLTVRAAEQAGLESLTLLEEPQAAFYAWLVANTNWRNEVQPGDVVLVCDVGGGTTDFSLIGVSQEANEIKLERLSVGEHILLGGDNMDLALAHSLRMVLEDQGHKLDQWQFVALVEQARRGKEQLLSSDGADDGAADGASSGVSGGAAEIHLSIASRSASLFANTISVALSRERVQEVILEGFFPQVTLNESPARRRASGLREVGLPYAVDAAITKHLAEFLSRSNVVPTAVLFNGGVFRSRPIREQLLSQLQSWFQTPIRQLTAAHLDLAVSLGAAYYGRLLESGEGLRIRAGLPRSYFVGLESTQLAVPGLKPPVQGLCVAPAGMEEGSELVLDSREFGLLVGEPVDFRFFASRSGESHDFGSTISDASRVLEELAELQVQLGVSSASSNPAGAGEVVPVKLHVALSDVGALELWMHHTQSTKRWKLELQLR